MDPTQIASYAQQLVVLLAPLVAQGAIQKIGENTTDATIAAVKRAWATLQQRFTGDRKAEAALTVFEDEAGDQKAQERLAQQIAARFNNQEAIAELAALVRELQALRGVAAPVGQTHAVNVSGNAKVVTAIAGNVHEGVHVGSIDFGDKTTVIRPPLSVKPVSAPPAARPALPATLSADGVHFTPGHALLIGIGTYADEQLSAPTTAADAAALGALLRDRERAAYLPERVQVLTSADATRGAIFQALDGLAKDLAHAPRDPAGPTAVIFFAGHGKRVGNRYYLLPHDYDSSRLTDTVIDAASFRSMVEQIAAYAERLLVILNCCHAGGIGGAVLDDAGEAEAFDAPPPEFYEPLARGSGQVVVSSSKAAEYSGAISSVDPRHTTFGAQLLSALRGAAPGQGAGIGIFDLFAHLSARVPPDAATITYKGRPAAQHPLFYASSVDQNFAVALRPGWQGDTLDVTLSETIQRLAEIEVALAQYSSESAAPEELVAERDGLLARLGV